ncbi:MAG: tRNA (N6-threonylcarbamoyladenosine(37)-N6)-methyltransferase TrmO [Dehalococcoidales bacterium]|nr:tRNA (N6-threonylcarbamoyladenosine(37)-N6)-methyltransferase TrmO [Dehalococcoidales bacterium]
MVQTITYEPIGIIHTPFKKQGGTPIQGVYAPDSRGKVEVFPRYVDGLKDITGFSHLVLIYHFHMAEGYSLLTEPFLDKGNKGIFAIRHFNRPNNIGLSIVRLYQVNVNLLEIGEVDMVDKTPLLDIKPYVPDFDNRHNVRNGWYENASNRTEYERNKGIPRRLEDFR